MGRVGSCQVKVTLSEVVAGLLVARAAGEHRSVSQMAALILEEGLAGRGGAESALLPSPEPSAGTTAAARHDALTPRPASPSKRFDFLAPGPDACPREAFHSKGVFCKGCGRVV